MVAVTGMTSDQMTALAAQNIIGASVNGLGHLILTTRGGSSIDAGAVVGPTGGAGPAGATGPTGTGPTGSVIMFAGPTAPSGWLLCSGAAVSRTTYAALFATIGTIYGVGDGTTTFNLPNMQARYPRMDSSNLGVAAGTLSHVHSIIDHAHAIDGGATAAVAHITMLSQAGQDVFIERLTGIGNWNAGIQADTNTIGSSSSIMNSGAKVSGTTNNAGLVTTGATPDNIPPHLNLNFIIKI